MVIWDGSANWRDLIPHGLDIKILYYPGTRGQKLNIATLASDAEYIACFDDDDWHSPRRISEQISMLQDSGKQVIATGDMLHYVPANMRLYRWTARGKGLPGASMLYSRIYGFRHPWTDKPIGADADFSKEAHKHGQLLVVSGQNWTIAREHSGNCTKRDIAYLAEISEQVTEIPLETDIRALLI